LTDATLNSFDREPTLGFPTDYSAGVTCDSPVLDLDDASRAELLHCLVAHFDASSHAPELLQVQEARLSYPTVVTGMVCDLQSRPGCLSLYVFALLSQSLVSNKRDLTCLLSYLARSVKFWDECVFRRFNEQYLRHVS
jgi:hypothetical protein